MTSPYANLFLAIQSLISNLQDDQQNTYFKYIDQDLGQLEHERPPVQWPCVLIDMDDFQFKPLSNNAQLGTGKITTRIGFPPFSPTSAATPDEYKQKAIYFYELEQILYLALQGWMDTTLQDIFGSMTRTSAFTERRTDLLRVRVLTWSVGIDDYSATQPQATPPAALNLTTELNFPI